MLDYLKPLDDWAETLATSGINITHQALLNARKLAEGKLDVVIVLIEPCNSHDMSYEEMFNRSSALQEVDRLVRACTGIYTILDVAVLDMKPLISEKMRQDLATQGYRLDEDKGYKIIEEILLIIKPEIILTLQCATKDAKSPVAKSLCGFTPGSERPTFIPTTRPNDYAANRDQAEIERLKRGFDGCFRSALLASNGKRTFRWNSSYARLKPWSWMCSMVAKFQGLSREDAEGMPPDHVFRSLNLLQMPRTRKALQEEMRIDAKLKRLAELKRKDVYESRPHRFESETQESIGLVNALSLD